MFHVFFIFRSKRYAFQVVVLGRSPLFFACDNEFLRSEWISVFTKYADESADLPSSHGRISPEGGPSASARQHRLPQTNSVYVDMKGEESNGRLSISGEREYYLDTGSPDKICASKTEFRFTCQHSVFEFDDFLN